MRTTPQRKLFSRGKTALFPIHSPYSANDPLSEHRVAPGTGKFGSITSRCSENEPALLAAEIEEKFVKQQVFYVQQAIFSPTKKDQITRGDKESLTLRIQSLPLENLVLEKKSNQQTKTTKTKTLGPKRRPHGLRRRPRGSSF